MARIRRKFSAEFKQETARLVTTRGVLLAGRAGLVGDPRQSAARVGAGGRSRSRSRLHRIIWSNRRQLTIQRTGVTPLHTLWEF